MTNPYCCAYCLRINGHAIGCPNYVPQKTNYICSFCKEDIVVGEEYVVNDDGNYAHLECLADVKETIKWLGYETRIANSNDIL